jgi:2-hydroxychromene-2-carboxylate isomerase
LSSPAPLLYFDLGSPYAYLAVERAAGVLGVAPELQPVLLGAIFARRGFGSWAATPARDSRIAEIEARAARYGLPPLHWPHGWPVDGLRAMRAATWAKQRGAVEPFARAVFRSEFGEGADISEETVLLDCADRVDLDAGQLADELDGAGLKLSLREATEDAWQAGVRGAPALRIGETVFYGDEQLELAAAALAGR